MEFENKYYYKVASPEYIKQADEAINEELASKYEMNISEGQDESLGQGFRR